MAFHGEPVRKTQSTPLNAPRLSSRCGFLPFLLAGNSASKAATRIHSSSVISDIDFTQRPREMLRARTVKQARKKMPCGKSEELKCAARSVARSHNDAAHVNYAPRRHGIHWETVKAKRGAVSTSQLIEFACRRSDFAHGEARKIRWSLKRRFGLYGGNIQ
jgi:hypothetical protein